MKITNKYIILILSLGFLFSCNSSKKNAGKGGVRGEIIPTQKSKKWASVQPHGMVPIPSGSFVLGNTDKDFTFMPSNTTPTTVTVSAFYMDDTEITNAEYRVFVNYVRDSITRYNLAEKAGDGGTDGGGEAISDYAFKSKKPQDEEATAYQQMLEEMGDRNGYTTSKALDWSVPLQWGTSEYPDVEYSKVLEEMYYPPAERFMDERTLDPRKLIYKFKYIDQIAAVQRKDRGQAFLKEENIAIYPDTTVWLRDFNYSYNEPMFEQYFWHEAFNEYPVVGVTWDQARAFSAYRTKLKNDWNSSQKRKINKVFAYRLPTEVEWEYAARGGRQNATYPWGGPYLIDDRGCYLANFKPRRGNYLEKVEKESSWYLYTGKVKTFAENGFGLYDMAGNVSEWTDSPYNDITYTIASTMNPYLGNRISEPRKTIRGGSWKDVGFLLMTGARDWEHMDSARSYIGFRCVQSVPESAKLRIKRQPTE